MRYLKYGSLALLSAVTFLVVHACGPDQAPVKPQAPTKATVKTQESTKPMGRMGTLDGYCEVTDIQPTYGGEGDEGTGWLSSGLWRKNIGLIEPLWQWRWAGNYSFYYTCATSQTSTDICQPCVDLELQEWDGNFSQWVRSSQPGTWFTDPTGGFPTGGPCGNTYNWTVKINIPTELNRKYRVRIRIGNKDYTKTDLCDWKLTSESPEWQVPANPVDPD